MKNIILPINPEYVDKIIKGEKNFEYRKKIPSETINYVIIYETAPVKKIVGFAKVDYILKERPAKLWEKTMNAGCVKKDFFFSYFQNVDYGYALKFSKVYQLKRSQTLKSIGINYIPQSFVYYDRDDINTLLKKCISVKPINNYIFLGGIHGSGKTSFSEKLLSTFGYSCVSASELIINS